MRVPEPSIGPGGCSGQRCRFAAGSHEDRSCRGKWGDGRIDGRVDFWGERRETGVLSGSGGVQERGVALGV